MTWVKICGTTNLDDALLAVEAGADALGFVFHKESPRCVAPELVRAIVRQLPSRMETVGVFVNEPGKRVEAVAEMVGLSAVQLHGDEYRDGHRLATDRKLYLAIPAGKLGSDLLASLPKDVGAILVDSGSAQQRGGTGKTFDWEAAREGIAALGRDFPVVVAGGLSAGNVGEVMAILRPWGVDVVSGVERFPGKKDVEKVRAFVAAVRGADSGLGSG